MLSLLEGDGQSGQHSGLAGAVLKPSGWLSEVGLGGGLSLATLPITLALIPPAISRCSVNTWC